MTAGDTGSSNSRKPGEPGWPGTPGWPGNSAWGGGPGLSGGYGWGGGPGWPGDEAGAGGQPPPAPGGSGGYPPAYGYAGYGSLRATDADRTRAQGLLQAAYADGRLTWEEFDARTSRLLRAQTYDDLTALTRDLSGQVVVPPLAYPPVRRGTNGMAIASLVCGIGQFAGLWLLGTIPAIVFGHMARRQIRQTGEGGDGLATAGLVLGWAGAALTMIVVAFLALFLIVGSAGGPGG
jgi:hypothetical protein